MSAETVETESEQAGTEDEAQLFSAELIGTLILVFFGVGSAVLAGEFIGSFGIALAFGFTLVLLAFIIGPVSGSHLNPVVSLAMFLSGRMTLRRTAVYWLAQFIGAIAGAALLFLVARQVPGLRTSQAFGTNGYGYRSAVGVSTFGALVAEVILTFLVVFVYLSVTHRIALSPLAAVPVGLTLAAVHLVGIPLTGTSVNPARSFAPAIFAGGQPWAQMWLFFVAPIVGALLAVLVRYLIHPHGERLFPGLAALSGSRTARAKGAGEQDRESGDS
ncbi:MULTISPECIES: MIP/aquaporin family protein [Streptomyces]|jgi:aquaporin Z|uniref:MIP/aquaporin family protein n=1 Tax=Streptomyces TaxID=1883 RepID=UPI001F327C63|nr:MULTISPECIES: aquaporin [unclassified Streptomyces]MCU4749024.1 aquaporin [Streptomyces sp. G-5]